MEIKITGFLETKILILFLLVGFFLVIQNRKRPIIFSPTGQMTIQNTFNFIGSNAH